MPFPSLRIGARCFRGDKGTAHKHALEAQSNTIHRPGTAKRRVPRVGHIALYDNRYPGGPARAFEPGCGKRTRSRDNENAVQHLAHHVVRQAHVSRRRLYGRVCLGGSSLGREACKDILRRSSLIPPLRQRVQNRSRLPLASGLRLSFSACLCPRLSRQSRPR